VDPHVLVKETEEVLGAGFFNDAEYHKQRAQLWQEKQAQLEEEDIRRNARREKNRERHEQLRKAIGEGSSEDESDET
jgi:hypothetical protein